MSVKLVIEFDNEEAAYHFGSWLCGSGEQNYWQWMEYREEEEEGDITAFFEYHSPLDESFPQNDKRRYANAKFLNGLKIKARCGRLSKGD